MLLYLPRTSYKFQVDDLITIGEADAAVNAAVKRVTHVNLDAGVLTLADWANSAAWPATTAAHADTVICVGTALIEGSDPGEARSADRTIRTNCTQIFGYSYPHVTFRTAGNTLWCI